MDARESRRSLPGCLVLVVGPSGAGKDSLIRHARERLAGDPRFAFPRRFVTRPPSDAEDNIPVSPSQFASMSAEGAFAASWTAHGLSYGIPATVDVGLAAACSVVCNVSRTVVQDLRKRYANVFVIEVTAPSEILASRLAARGRATDGDASERLRRSSDLGSALVDHTVTNAGALEPACEAFLKALVDSRPCAGPSASPVVARPSGTAPSDHDQQATEAARPIPPSLASSRTRPAEHS